MGKYECHEDGAVAFLGFDSEAVGFWALEFFGPLKFAFNCALII